MTDTIRLIGLPGSGKTRFKNAFQAAFPDASIEEVSAGALAPMSQPQHTWCVIDARYLVGDDEAQAWLKAMLQTATGVVFSFMDAADMTVQSQWQAWLKSALPQPLPRYRWFSHAALGDWDWHEFDTPSTIPSVDYSAPSLESLCFEFNAESRALNLEHLLFGLDTMKQNLGARLWRVQGIVMTSEYQNPVALEGQIDRWDTYAGELTGPGYICMQGQTLQRDLLQEIIDASCLS